MQNAITKISLYRHLLILTTSLTLILLLLVGCQSVGSKMATWYGHSTNELIDSWGPPASTFEHGDSTWYVYETSMGFGGVKFKRSFKVEDGIIVGHRENSSEASMLMSIQ